ncbi:4Fe-4S dicluster domain-containing protein [Desulfovibrio ferrophilus]|uniref:4Fe-4S ferredoxin n=1 Tax=Desulfovibrio ferrophilus TaxID=241368 RepID=A0A2Z6AU93_9BACT|nr:4Fe-4S dicluster domain-containing protein [Desulfovibrio ferrophilus]BBD06802.1 4Fe-4S ferredoxin [Desulfovibrio ferrophilus]
MRQLSIMVDLDRCIGCKTCIVACRNHHDIIDHENDQPGAIPNYLRVESKLEGTFPSLQEDYWVVMCQHCKKTPCAKVCEVGAITKDEQTGIVLIDQEKCNGCGECIDKCPYKVIQFNKQNNYAHKCNMCYDRVTHGLDPVCVDVCLTDALSFGEKEILLMQAEADGKQVIKKMSTQSIIYTKTP